MGEKMTGKESVWCERSRLLLGRNKLSQKGGNIDQQLMGAIAF